MNAMQDHRTALIDPELARADLAVGMFDLPAVATGQTAAVFHVSQPDSAWAVRCLTLEGSHLPDRYAALEARLRAVELHYFVSASWQEAGIRTNGDYWPIVKMEWVDGTTLADWVSGHLSDPHALRSLKSRFELMLADIWRAGVAHGDLQHGNIVVRQNGDIVLVDYDSCLVFDAARPHEAFTAQSGDAGHPNYQHPHRVETGATNAWVDTFSGLVISTSLEALAARPDLWSSFHNDENLIFTAADLDAPGDTAVWRELATIPTVASQLALLEQLCRRDSLFAATFEAVVSSGVPAGVSWTKTRHVEQGSASDAHAVWGEPDSSTIGGATSAPLAPLQSSSSVSGQQSNSILSRIDVIWLIVLIAAVVGMIVAISVLSGRS